MYTTGIMPDDETYRMPEETSTTSSTGATTNILQPHTPFTKKGNNMKQGKKAFTLVELMIVIAIIGVLVGMLTPMISGAQKRALATTSKTLFSNMVSALERYQTEYGYYPAFLTSRDRTNLAQENFSEGMIKALTGKTPEGGRLTQSDRASTTANRATFWTSRLRTSSSARANGLL